MLTRRIIFILSLSLLTGTLLRPGDAQKLTWLGTLGGGWSYATGVSADGSVVVGESETADGKRRAFLWSPTVGMIDLGTLGGEWSYASAVSADGSTVVGTASRDDGTWRAFRWTLAGGMTELVTLTNHSRAFGVSADGSIIVGADEFALNLSWAVRWIPSAVEYLQPAGYGNLQPIYAFGVSAAGDVCVGQAQSRLLPPEPITGHAFWWTPALGAQNLGTLGRWSYALGVSANGEVVVGESFNADSLRRAFRWSQAGGMQELLPPAGFRESSAMAVSGDGSVVVGEVMNPDDGGHAARWTAPVGAEDLNEILALLLADGSILSFAAGVSPDARYIVGGGYHASTGLWEAFVLDTAARFTVSGTVELQDFAGDRTQVPVTVELRRGGLPVLQQTLTLSFSGTYTLSGLGIGTYDLLFSASHWLRRLVRGVVVAGSDVSAVDASLINGDIDGDNEVTLFDFGHLVLAFGSVPGDDNWNPNADLDGDEDVSLFDFGILVRNFGATGDE